MWSATVNEVRNEQVGTEGLRTAVNITFTDGASQKFSQDLFFTSGTKDDVYKAIQNKLDNLNATDTLKTDVALGVFVPKLP